ncbi:hypothetical protein [Chitinophaga defluvii]|uniref:Copper chaperone CopZ n=1 Tax=Chitinophaga defluvii TaxID=3163343 RepID=A0ABV2TGK9_9BACT
MLLTAPYPTQQKAMIGIFKTNIATKKHRQQMIHAIETHFEVSSCHVDLDDCDKVLRIADMKVAEEEIIRFVKNQGFHCEILD